MERSFAISAARLLTLMDIATVQTICLPRMKVRRERKPGIQKKREAKTVNGLSMLLLLMLVDGYGVCTNSLAH